MITCTRRFSVDAGHRVLRHESKCANLHGHTYAFEVTVRAPELDALGRVVDFGVLKAQVGEWLDAHWDHATIVNHEDVDLWEWLQAHGQKHYRLPFNPTAENLARYLGKVAHGLLPATLEVVQVVCQETPNCSATWTPP